MTHVCPVRFTEHDAAIFDRLSTGEWLGDEPLRLGISVIGLVQGVGFRPFVLRTAERQGLAGFVRNTIGGVEIEAEGSAKKMRGLLEALQVESPSIAEIERIDVTVLEPAGGSGFQVIESTRSNEEASLVSADVATCEECLHELRDPGDRRYGYPFLNCTNCGPRFTIVETIPYDRERTTMRSFELCPECAKEYGDCSNRRFHAEPIACPVCGPRVTLIHPFGHTLDDGDRALEKARSLILEGQIIAVKGLGGFHLACDATRGDAVSRLRQGKGRPFKPLAVMCRDLGVVRSYCDVSPEEASMLEGIRRPMLLLKRRTSPETGLPPLAAAVAPGMDDVGVMLPYTPLHHLLFEGNNLLSLVMTSGNCSEEPIAGDNTEALTRLGGIADAFLIHDRSIWNRCDDSVGFMDGDKLVLMRRSRGFTPLPVPLNRKVEPTLAVGTMTNNVFALASGCRAFLSQHIGSVDNLDTLAFMRESIEKFRRWLAFDPVVVAHDLHPDLLTTHLAHELAAGCRRVAVQHHHAHFAAALAAAGIDEEAQGLVLDGTGWGPDRTIWGGELLVGSIDRIKRAGHLRPLPLPGGEAAIRKPVRLAAAYLHVLAPSAAKEPLDIWRRISAEEVAVVRRMVDRGFNTPLTSSAGRLFDAVSALLGVRDEVTYEGQAAIELEQLARRGAGNRGPKLRLEIKEQEGTVILDPEALLGDLVDALLNNCDCADLALGFHVALAESLANACSSAGDSGGPEKIMLCGGVFQNRVLTHLTKQALEAAGLQPVPPGLIPVNDGGIALGQVLIANAVTRGEGE